MIKRLACAALLGLMTFAASGATVVVSRTTDLRAERYSDAAALMQLQPGTSAELVATEAGWVQVRVAGQTGWIRATGLVGEAANMSALARLETGRSAIGNIVVAAGVRGIRRAASKQALIIGVDAVVTAGMPEVRWDGVADDVDAARLIARRIGVPDDNIDVVNGPDATFDGIGQAFDRLAQRMQVGDQVMLYFSGPGTQRADDGCSAAWLSADGRPLSAAAIVDRLRATLSVAAKVVVISDATIAGAGPVPAQSGLSLRTLPTTGSGCRRGTGQTELPFVRAAISAGVAPENIVTLQSGPGALQGALQSPGGGLFTQALADCMLGDATDTDRSGSLSMSEIAACMDRHRPGARADRATPPVSLTGNAAFTPLVGLVAPSTSAPAATARAAIADLYAQRDGRIAVTLTATPSTLQIGRDELDLTLTSAKAGFVYLVLLGSDGQSFYLLFPNALDGDNRIAAGESMRLPHASWRVRSQGPAGHDTLLAIVAESERDLSPLAARKEGPFSTSLTDAAGRAQLQQLFSRPGRADADDCAVGGPRRNLAAVKVCSDAFGAALVDILER